MKEKLDNICQEIKFTLMAHILNPMWHSRIKRRRRRGKYSYAKVEHYLKKYHDFAKNLPIEEKAELSKGDDKIFSIWYQGEQNAPKLVKLCFQRLKEIYGGRYVILDSESISEWVDLPDYIWKKWNEGKISKAHFSDICRVALLYQHGGMWFDATDYLTSKVPEWIEEADLFIYQEGNRITPGTLIQSCFMRAKKGHPLFGAWLKMIYKYWKEEDRLVHYFLLHYLLRFLVENNPDISRLYYTMPQIDQTPTHNLWHYNCDMPYSPEKYQELTEDTFFQKTTFKSKRAETPIAGTMADYIINGITEKN
ncbi:MAG: hypothetical protein J1F12_05080 [Muribaculaceae bacterium]|nr:hypothetical protein [Muribaculaceae bacterium]